MVATSSRTGRPSGSSDISSDAWLCVGLRIIRKYKKTFTTKFILAGLSEWSTQAFHFMKPFLAMHKGGDSDVSVSAMLVSMRQKNIAQVSILERYFFVSTYQAAGPDTCLAVFVVASLPLCL